MADFRNLARSHNVLAQRHNELLKEHDETRKVLTQLIEAHNRFVSLSFWQRVRWVFRGKTQ